MLRFRSEHSLSSSPHLPSPANHSMMDLVFSAEAPQDSSCSALKRLKTRPVLRGFKVATASQRLQQRSHRMLQGPQTLPPARRHRRAALEYSGNGHTPSAPAVCYCVFHSSLSASPPPSIFLPPCILVQYGAFTPGEVQCSAVQCSAVQCGAVQCSAVRCSAVQCSAVQCGAVRCSEWARGCQGSPACGPC